MKYAKFKLETVEGPAHRAKGLPNQDAVQGTQHNWPDFIVVAVADGHGSTVCFRSDQGSRLAVQAAIHVAVQWFNAWSAETRRPEETVTEKESVARSLSEKWRELVNEAIARTPFTDEEIQKVLKTDGQAGVQRIRENSNIAYGTTVLCAAASDTAAIYFQIGDGEILSVSHDGEVQRPLGSDPTLFANQTTSLSSPDASCLTRVRIETDPKKHPRLILLCTDGYSNSFETDEGLLLAASDFARLLSSPEGEAEANAHLRSWLTESSENTGDDTSIGLIFEAPSHHDDTTTATPNQPASSDDQSSLIHRTVSL